MNPFRDALELHPQPSRRLAALTLGAHGTAVIVVVAAALKLPAIGLLLLPVAVSAMWYWRRQRYGSPADIVRLTCRADGSWRWQRADGRVGVGTLAASSVCTPAAVVLHLRRSDRWRSRAVLLLPDSLDPDSFRRLRARLRLAAGTAD